jgi:hypothetical protein
MTSRSAITLAAVALAVVLVGLWLLFPGPAEESSSRPTATPSPTPTVATAASPAATPGPPAGYRLAGVAGGDERSFVAVELPDGSTELFRLGADVPGLGRLVRIEEKRATFEGADGAFSMQVGPKPTPTGLPPTPTEMAVTPVPL